MALFKTKEQPAQAAVTVRADGELPTRDEIAAYHLYDEPRLVGALIERAAWSDGEVARTVELARRLVTAARGAKVRAKGFEVFTRKIGSTTRVRVGPFETRDAAERAAKKLAAQGYKGVVMPQG